MEIKLDEHGLKVIKSLSNENRIKIIKALSKGNRNITQLSKDLNISKAMVTKHVQQLEEVGIVNSKINDTSRGNKKIVQLAVERININLPKKIFAPYSFREYEIPIGHYTNYEVYPTCGIASQENVIGMLDEPRYFMDPNRMNAEILWFSQGFVEYQIPNFIKSSDEIKLIEISMEIASEFPKSNNVWPSDITFFFNDFELGTWTIPGNFSDVRGILNPSWWPDENSQYGLLKTLRIYPDDTYIDGEFLSDLGLKDVLNDSPLYNLTFKVKEDAKNRGGLTIFGSKFGNYNQNIKIRIYQSEQ